MKKIMAPCHSLSSVLVGFLACTACTVVKPNQYGTTGSASSSSEGEAGSSSATDEESETENSTTTGDPSDSASTEEETEYMPEDGENCNPDLEPSPPQNGPVHAGKDRGSEPTPGVFSDCNRLIAPSSFDAPPTTAVLTMGEKSYELGRTIFGGILLEDEAGHLFDDGFIMTLVPNKSCSPKVEISIIDQPTPPFTIDFEDNSLCPGSAAPNAFISISYGDSCSLLAPATAGSLVVNKLDEYTDGTIELSASGTVLEGGDSIPFELDVFVDLSFVDEGVGLQALVEGDMCAP